MCILLELIILTDIMSLLKTVLTKPKGYVTPQQLVRIQETFVRESAAANQRWMKKFREEEHQKQEALARAEKAEQLIFELEERTIKDEELRTQMSIEQNEKNALKQFEFEEVRILISSLLLQNAKSFVIRQNVFNEIINNTNFRNFVS